ncbi:MAG: hypothetical protein ABIN83_03900 [Sphingomicrobium sp.]
MISFLIGSAIGLTALQAGIDIPRKNFVACIHDAFDKAVTQKVAADDYGAFLLTSCGGQAGNLKAGLVGFDVKNGIRRAQASSDAQAQIDDYVALSSEKYESRMGKPKLAAGASPAPTSATPPATAAAAPKR